MRGIIRFIVLNCLVICRIGLWHIGIVIRGRRLLLLICFVLKLIIPIVHNLVKCSYPVFSVESLMGSGSESLDDRNHLHNRVEAIITNAVFGNLFLEVDAGIDEELFGGDDAIEILRIFLVILPIWIQSLELRERGRRNFNLESTFLIILILF